MAVPVTGAVSGGRGGINITLEPPIDFILKQTGAYQRDLVLRMPELWESFKPVLGEMEDQQFSTEGMGAWPPLADSTLAEKSRLGFPSDTLVRTSALKDSLLDPNSAMHIEGESAWYGTEVEYAYFHQTGGWVANRPPMRQVIPDPVPIETRRQLEERMVAWVNLLARETWGRI